MGVCEPGQGGNAAAISNTFMCLGEPPRLSPALCERAASESRMTDLRESRHHGSRQVAEPRWTLPSSQADEGFVARRTSRSHRSKVRSRARSGATPEAPDSPASDDSTRSADRASRSSSAAAVPSARADRRGARRRPTRSSPGDTGRSGSRTSSGKTMSCRPCATRSG